jgi:hypothetical protein
MTFDEWWKSYDLFPFDLMDDYEDHPSEYKVKEICKKAYEAGFIACRDKWGGLGYEQTLVYEEGE